MRITKIRALPIAAAMAGFACGEANRENIELPGAPSAGPDAAQAAGPPDGPTAAPTVGPADVREIAPPHFGHDHDGLEPRFHRTLLYGGGHSTPKGCLAYGVPVIDDHCWWTALANDPERLEVLVDLSGVYREVAGPRPWEPELEPYPRCRIDDVRMWGEGRDRFARWIADDTPRLIREATGRAWRRPAPTYANRAPEPRERAVVLRFVVAGCGGRGNAAGCATIGDGGFITIVVDTNCRGGGYTRTDVRELFAHELGHALGFRHPDGNRHDEMTPGSYDGHVGYSRRERDHMRHAFAHDRGWRGEDGRHVDGPRRPRRPIVIYD